MAIFKSLEEVDRDRKRIRRRRFLATALAGGALLLGHRWWRRRPRAIAQRSTGYLTPPGQFFTVAINPAFRPKISPETFHLVVKGPQREATLGLNELRALPAVERFRTLVCISNPVGGTAIGNARWKGTPLGMILREVLPSRREGLFVTFRGLDGFHSTVLLELAMRPETLIVYEINGRALSARHGFPLRVLIPDRYGMKQPKWLSVIEVSRNYGWGYWERRGWSHTAPLRPSSRIDSAARQADGSWLVKGIAFCGGEAVSIVDFSDNDGEDWQSAGLLEPALPGAWSQWQIPWKPRLPGRHILSCRVQSATGKVQAEEYSGSFPSGSSGIHRVVVEVE